MARVWNRVLALCGVGFVVVTLIGAGIEGSVPHPDASTAAIVKFYASHKTHVEVGTVVLADAVVLILLFAAYLRRHLDRDAPATWPTIIAMTGTVIFAVSGLLEFSAAFTIAHFSSKLEPSAALAYNAAGATGGSISTIGTCALLAGFGIAIIRSRQLPAWLGWIAAALAVVQLAGPLISNAIEPVVFLWFVVTSIFLAIRTTAEGRTVPTS